MNLVALLLVAVVSTCSGLATDLPPLPRHVLSRRSLVTGGGAALFVSAASVVHPIAARADERKKLTFVEASSGDGVKWADIEEGEKGVAEVAGDSKVTFNVVGRLAGKQVCHCYCFVSESSLNSPMNIQSMNHRYRDGRLWTRKAMRATRTSKATPHRTPHTAHRTPHHTNNCDGANSEPHTRTMHDS